MATMTRIRIHPVTPAIGAIVDGADLRRPLDADTVAQIRRAFLDHGVVFFPRQPLDREQFSAFGSYFSTPIPEPFLDVFPDRTLDPISISSLTPTRKSTAVWHSDTTFAQAPPMATLLRAVKLPPLGGDTCWASMYAAYDALSAPLRGMLDPLTAAHSVEPVLRTLGDFGGELRAHYARPDVATEHFHPVVRVHPETGRRALFVNEAWTTRIVGLEQAESAALLQLLFNHVKSPEFALRWRWTEHDVVLWDNRCVQHFAVPDYTEERVMQRTYLAGDHPFGPAPAGA